MSDGINIKIDSSQLNTIVREVDRLRGAAESNAVKMEMGFAVMQAIRAHFAQIAQDSDHHQSARSLGADPTGFYEQARQNTLDPVLVENGVMIAVDQIGFRQRYYGGEIEAINGWLTIPAQAIAYGKRAREFDLRFVIFGDTGLAALVDPEKKNADEGDVYYWLVRSVTQLGDTSIFPTDDEIIEAARAGARNYIETVWSES